MLSFDLNQIFISKPNIDRANKTSTSTFVQRLDSQNSEE